MQLQLTAVFKKVPEGYIGFVEELPGANTQGATLEEARANLVEANQSPNSESDNGPKTSRDRRLPRTEDLSGPRNSGAKGLVSIYDPDRNAKREGTLV